MNSKLLIGKKVSAIDKQITKNLELLLLLTYDTDLSRLDKSALIGLLTNNRRKLNNDRRLAAIEFKKKKAKHYSMAVKNAAKRLERRQGAFPRKCPFGITQILNSEFIPKVKELPSRPYQLTKPQELFADLGESGYESVRCEHHMKNYYYILRRKISNKMCSIIAIPPGRFTGLADGAIFSVDQKPKLLFHSKFPKENLKEVRNFIKRNENVIKKYWHGKINPPELIESLFTDRGHQIVERARIGYFSSKSETWRVVVWANSLTHIRLTSLRGINARVNMKSFTGEYFEKNKLQWRKLDKTVLMALKYFLQQKHHNLNATNWDCLLFIWQAINDDVNIKEFKID